jgi:hypothetical protein
MPDYIVLLRYSGADGLFHVSEIQVTEADDEADARESAVAAVLKPGDKLDDAVAIPHPTKH